MPAHPQSTWSSNGAGRGNLFVDADPDLDGIDSATTPTTTSVDRPARSRSRCTDRATRSVARAQASCAGRRALHARATGHRQRGAAPARLRAGR